jgi:hypothetical protein
MNTDRDSELLREPEVTSEYKLTGPWLRKTRRVKRRPPFIRVGRMVFYCRNDLDAFVAAHRVEPNDGLASGDRKDGDGR